MTKEIDRGERQKREAEQTLRTNMCCCAPRWAPFFTILLLFSVADKRDRKIRQTVKTDRGDRVEGIERGERLQCRRRR
jgi:hypothetical protein